MIQNTCSHGGVYTVNPSQVKIDFSSNINPFGTSKVVLNALRKNLSKLSSIYPDNEHEDSLNGFLKIIETSGIDYSTDLIFTLEKLKPSVVFVLPSDMPLITSELINRIISKWEVDQQCMSIILDKEFIINLGLLPTIPIKSVGKEYFYSGITIFDSGKIQRGQVIKEHYITLNSERLAFNINTEKDFLLLSSKKINQGY